MIQPMQTREIFVDPDNKQRTVAVTPELAAEFPGLLPAFGAIDRTYSADPEKFLHTLEQSIHVAHVNGTAVTYALFHDGHTEPGRLNIRFTPFSDVEPASTAKELAAYNRLAREKPSTSFVEKFKAKQNTWGALLRGSTNYEIARRLGENVASVVIFSPIKFGAYNARQHWAAGSGDFSSDARIVETIAKDAGRHLGTGTNLLDLEGASIGSTRAIAAAAKLAKEYSYPVKSVYVQELVLEKNIGSLAKHFMVDQLQDDPEIQEPTTQHILREPRVRREADLYGSDPITNNVNMVRGISRLFHLVGLTKPERLRANIEALLANETPVLGAFATNSTISAGTQMLFSELGLPPAIIFRATAGKRIGHIINEFTSASAIAPLLARKSAQ